MSETPLDRAHRAMTAAPGDDSARPAFYDLLAMSELYLLLAEEAAGATPISPLVFPLEDGPVVAAFDLPERLAGFTGGPAPNALLSGRALVARLSEAGMGLALNLGAASELLLPASAIAWFADRLTQAPQRLAVRPERLGPPGALPQTLLSALDAKLAAAAGLARAAVLAEADYGEDGSAPLLAFVDAVPGAQAALSQAVSEAVAFSGGETFDIGFVASGSGIADALLRVGLRIELPAPVVSPAGSPTNSPGSDPTRPPRLR